MPRGDGTGPFNAGPMTGRAAGYCRGGFGRRNRFYTDDLPIGAYAPPESEPILLRDEEIAQLRSESERLRTLLETIERRLAQIETI